MIYLNKNLNEEIDLNKYSPRIQRLIEEKNAREIARLMKKGEIKQTKELLMLQNKNGNSVVHFLINEEKGKLNKEFINDRDILLLKDEFEICVAYYLAENYLLTKWTTNDKELLMIQNKIDGRSVAYYLARYSAKSGWTTNDKDILMMQDNYGDSVAHELAYYHPTWTTNDPEILKLNSFLGKGTVEDVLIVKRKIK